MAQRVAGEMYFDIDGQLGEIKRQLRQLSGYPFNLRKLKWHLQDAIEGRFPFSSVMPVDRSKPFNLAKLIGEKGWTIWRGSDGLQGEAEQDERSLVLTEVDLNKIHLKSCQVNITGEERLEYLGSACVRLDMQVFWTLFRNQHLIPESWYEKINGYTPHIFFDGTVLRNPYGIRFVYELQYDCDEDKWCYCYQPLSLTCYVSNISAVLLN